MHACMVSGFPTSASFKSIPPSALQTSIPVLVLQSTPLQARLEKGRSSWPATFPSTKLIGSFCSCLLPSSCDLSGSPIPPALTPIFERKKNPDRAPSRAAAAQSPLERRESPAARETIRCC